MIKDKTILEKACNLLKNIAPVNLERSCSSSVIYNVPSNCCNNYSTKLIGEYKTKFGEFEIKIARTGSRSCWSEFGKKNWEEYWGNKPGYDYSMKVFSGDKKLLEFCSSELENVFLFVDHNYRKAKIRKKDIIRLKEQSSRSKLLEAMDNALGDKK